MAITYNDLYIEARKKLREANIEAFALEARFLIATASKKKPEKVLADLNLYTSDEVAQKVREMISRRVEGEPIAYICGEWEFFGIPIIVNRDVLIPRADTEVIVEAAVACLRGRKMDARVMDLCTGSGCIGCAIAKQLPAARVTLADCSGEALAVAKQNVYANKLNPRVACVEADALKSPPLMLGSFDIIVCNPPYIPTADMDTLDDSVKKFEPRLALDGGADGLDFFRAILKNWKCALRPGGILMFEVGIGQADEVCELMTDAGFAHVGHVKDTQGIDRVCFGNIK
jgi:release factor glutamine methyltransferase